MESPPPNMGLKRILSHAQSQNETLGYLGSQNQALGLSGLPCKPDGLGTICVEPGPVSVSGPVALWA